MKFTERLAKRKKEFLSLYLALSLGLSGSAYAQETSNTKKNRINNEKTRTKIEQKISSQGSSSQKKLKITLPKTRIDLSAYLKPYPAKPLENIEKIMYTYNDSALETLNSAQEKQEFRFIVIGDSTTKHNRKYIKLLSQIEELEPTPQFVIHLGDFVRNGKIAQYAEYLQIVHNFSYPIIHVAGNHDLRRDGRHLFPKVIGDLNHFFDYGNNRFIIMSDAFEKHKQEKRLFGFSNEQLAWLEDLLDDPEPVNKMIFAHAPPEKPFSNYATGAVLSLKRKLKNQEQFNDLIDRYDVKLAAFGHHHLYIAVKQDETIYMISGGGGQVKDKLSTGGRTRHYTSDHHFVVIDQFYDGHIRGEVVRLKKSRNSKKRPLIFYNR